jgi:hypothetical protein
MKLKGQALWTKEQLQSLEKFGKSLSNLLSEFPPDRLYLHPIKLSQWQLDLDVSHLQHLDAQNILAHSGYKNQISNLRIENGDLCFTSTGLDPYLFLPRINLNPNGITCVTVEITAPEKTAVQLFHQPIGQTGFHEESSSMKPVHAGRQTVAWTIGPGINGDFRLDPGLATGDYRIHSITFRQ